MSGRDWALSDEAGFTSEHQANRVVEAFNELFETFQPREKYELINANDYRGKFINHKTIY
jgi:hypothetical protein